MKIIYSDNIPSDTSSEYIWLEAIPLDHVGTAQRVCDKLNDNLGRLGECQGPFYRVVKDQHKLYKWEP